MNLDKIIITYNPKANSPLNYEIEFKMKDPSISFIMEYSGLKISDNDFRSQIEGVEKSFKSIMPLIINSLSVHSSKEYAQGLKDDGLLEEYEKYIKWFPENS